MSGSEAIRGALPRPVRKAIGAASGFLENAQMRVFDRLMGVSTRERVFSGQSVFTTGSDYCPYQGCQWIPLNRVLRALSPGPGDVFVDIGAGKGKAVLIAGRLPFGKVIGVEFDDDLSAGARRNIERARGRLRAGAAECVTADALRWPIPDDASVIFMYNPFIGQTFRDALGRVFESYDRRPRDLHVIYWFPWEHDWLVSTGRVVVDNVQPIQWPAMPGWWRSGSVVVSYRVTGGGLAADRLAPGGKARANRQAMRRWSEPNQHRFTMSQPGREPVHSR